LRSSQFFAIVGLGVSLGLAAGLGSFTFLYGRGWSYLTNDPAACANCHVMHEQFDGWVKSSHRAVAACNDCHTPPGLLAKYYVKASNGFWHSFYFTAGGFHEPIRITSRNREVTESACRKCHEDIVAAIEGAPGFHSGRTECLRCHGSVGHMELGANR
jgi:cytochrome c nitrite reductase small subunit